MDETLNIEAGIESELRNKGADFVLFADISHISTKQKSEYPRAIVFGIALAPEYLMQVSQSDQISAEMFHETERKTDHLADHLADYLSIKGYTAFSQSENNLLSAGLYQEDSKTTPLPHKTIARLAGLGWIGKHNLLISPKFGSAISICTVLSDVPVNTVSNPAVGEECGDCTVCIDICQVKALKGATWKMGIHRDALLDVSLCQSCLKCLVLCPWTQNYYKRNLQNI